jgi:hypothetical protein
MAAVCRVVVLQQSPRDDRDDRSPAEPLRDFGNVLYPAQFIGTVAPLPGFVRVNLRHNPLDPDAGVDNDCAHRSRSSRNMSALSLNWRPDAVRRW